MKTISFSILVTLSLCLANGCFFGRDVDVACDCKNTDLYSDVYNTWKNAIRQPLIATRNLPGPYVQCPEARKLILLGKRAVPFLVMKMEEDQQHGKYMTFIICEIMGYNREEIFAGIPRSDYIAVLKRKVEADLSNRGLLQ